MGQTWTILILSQSSEGGARIRRIVATSKDLEVVGVGEAAPEALTTARALAPDVITVDSAWGQKVDVEFIRSLASLVPSSVIMLVAPDGDMGYVQEALLAGARGFVMRSNVEAQLISAIERVLELESAKRIQQVQARKRGVLPEDREGRVISIFSSKGGVGCTVVAVNLAVALRRQTGQPVALFDCQLRFGTTAVLLNLWPRASLADLARYERDLNKHLVEEAMLEHSSGIKVLLPPPTLEEAEQISPQLVTRALEILKGSYEFVVVDTGAYLDSIALAVLDFASKVVLVTTPEVPALHNLRRMLELTERLGYSRDKVMVLGNRFSASWGIKPTDIAESLGYPICVSLPSDGRLVTQAANRGVPFVMDAPDSDAARAIYELADLLKDSEPGFDTRGRPQSP
jgi:pilus assembly protein CpaE